MGWFIIIKTRGQIFRGSHDIQLELRSFRGIQKETAFSRYNEILSYSSAGMMTLDRLYTFRIGDHRTNNKYQSEGIFSHGQVRVSLRRGRLLRQSFCVNPYRGLASSQESASTLPPV